MISRKTLNELCNGSVPLVSGMIDPKEQIQQHGIDFTLQKIETLSGCGVIDFDNTRRKIPETRELQFYSDGALHLDPGCYKVTFNEEVNMPLNIGAIARTRSSLQRSGVMVETAVWDAGYHGRSTGLLMVLNPQGVTLYKNAKMIQLVFFMLDQATDQGYNGIYQGENLDSKIPSIIKC